MQTFCSITMGLCPPRENFTSGLISQPKGPHAVRSPHPTAHGHSREQVVAQGSSQNRGKIVVGRGGEREDEKPIGANL